MTADDDYVEDLRAWHDEDDPDGAALLDELHETFTSYVVFLNKHASVAATLWVAATHALPAFECAPRLAITSPQKRCAKSRLLDVIVGTCHKPLATSNATVAAVFRSIGDKHPPTLIIDEADTLWGSKRAAENNEDLRALLNAGHQQGRPALRCVGPSQTPTPFNTFAMAALAGIGTLPDTITDRAVNITMRRRTPNEKVSQFRSRRDGPKLKKLQVRLAAWATAHIDELTKAEPKMPVQDRAADTWEPLIAIADAVGGHWPKDARAACKALVAAADAADEEGSLPIKLLADIRQIFTNKDESFLPSNDLVTELRRIEDSPWDDFDLTRNRLAYRLKEFGVKTAHNVTATARGYRLEDFEDVFTRYTRQEPSGTVNQQVKQGDQSDGSQRQPVNPSGTVNHSKPSTSNVDGLTLLDGLQDAMLPLCEACGVKPAEWGDFCTDCCSQQMTRRRPGNQ